MITDVHKYPLIKIWVTKVAQKRVKLTKIVFGKTRPQDGGKVRSVFVRDVLFMEFRNTRTSCTLKGSWITGARWRYQAERGCGFLGSSAFHFHFRLKLVLF